MNWHITLLQLRITDGLSFPVLMSRRFFHLTPAYACSRLFTLICSPSLLDFIWNHPANGFQNPSSVTQYSNSLSYHFFIHPSNNYLLSILCRLLVWVLGNYQHTKQTEIPNGADILMGRQAIRRWKDRWMDGQIEGWTRRGDDSISRGENVYGQKMSMENK